MPPHRKAVKRCTPLFTRNRNPMVKTFLILFLACCSIHAGAQENRKTIIGEFQITLDTCSYGAELVIAIGDTETFKKCFEDASAIVKVDSILISGMERANLLFSVAMDDYSTLYILSVDLNKRTYRLVELVEIWHADNVIEVASNQELTDFIVMDTDGNGIPDVLTNAIITSGKIERLPKYSEVLSNGFIKGKIRDAKDLRL